MKITVSSLMVVLLGVVGCATVDHSVMINTDKTDAYTEGQFRDIRYGQMGGWGFWVLGGYSGDNTPSPYPWPWTAKQGDSDPVKFARAVSMINYSKRLKSVSYDSTGQIVGYEFDNKPFAGRSDYRQAPVQPKLPASFGHQPIE